MVWIKPTSPQLNPHPHILKRTVDKMQRRTFLFASLLAPFVSSVQSEARRTPEPKDAIVNDDDFFWENDVCPVVYIVDSKGQKHGSEKLFKSVNMTSGYCVVRSGIDVDLGVFYRVIKLPAPLTLINQKLRIFTESDIRELTKDHDFEMFSDHIFNEVTKWNEGDSPEATIKITMN